VYNQFDYTLDPHGAVAYLALEKYLSSHPLHKGFILETAHPVKFPYAVENATEKEVDIPEVLKEMMTLEKESILLSPDFESLKSYLLSE